MSLKLLNILREEISEQGIYRKMMVTPSSGKRSGEDVGALRFDDKGEFLGFIKPEDVGKKLNELDVNTLDQSLIRPLDEVRGKTYGWRAPIMYLCNKGIRPDRYCKYHWHHGRDYGLSIGHPIVSLRKGKVKSANRSGEWVLAVEYPDGSLSRFVHCDDIFVSAGDEIKPGQIIANTGNKGRQTVGPHLHYEYYPPSPTPMLMTHHTGVTAKVTDTDPIDIDYKIFAILKKGNEEAFEESLNSINLSKPTDQTNTNAQESSPIFDKLPQSVKNAINKLRSYGVNITEKNLEKEMTQEGETREDAGSVNTIAKEQILLLLSDLKKDFPNVTTSIVSDYRSYNDQVENFRKKVQDDKRTIDDVQSYNTIPGFSQHHTGLAFDIISTDPSWWDLNPKVKKWVAEKCGDYGFEVTYKKNGIRKAEPWHLFYVGQISEEEEDVEEVEDIDGLTVVIGGADFATAEYMKKQWIMAGLSTDNVKFINQRDSLPSGKISKIMGFSGGGSKVWKEIISNSSNYSFIGLIDPYTQGEPIETYVNKLISGKTSLPDNVYSLCNYKNWGGQYGKTRDNLEKLEDNNVLLRGNYQHTAAGNYPYNFFVKYKNILE
jgi:LAS superfamily LD-carboxypeptidase LdcB